MKTLTAILCSTAIFLYGGIASANSPQSGLLAVYGSQYQGKPTASGELYRMDQMTAAHESLPFGSIVRVAHFETGKMVDVRVNDRKSRDSHMLHLSHAAGRALGIPEGRSVQGSMYVVGAPAPRAVNHVGQAAPAVAPAPVPAPARSVVPIAPMDNQVQKPFRPFAEWRQREALKKAVNNPGAERTVAGQGAMAGLFGKDKSVQYGIPAEKYSPPAPAGVAGPKQGGLRSLFAGRNQMQAVPQQPANAINALPPGSSVVPLSAPSRPAPAVQRSAPTNPAPYRAQFGAFRKVANAQELADSLNRSGVPTLIAPATGRPLHLVISNASFPTAEQAQNWINHEAARRRWAQRPVVIR